MKNIKKPIIIDNGKSSIKAGYSNEEKPSTSFPTIIGKYKSDAIQLQDHDILIGQLAIDEMQKLDINTPIRNRVIENFEDMFLIWDYLYYEKLKAESHDHPVLLTESIYNPDENRIKTAEIFFEKFGVPAFYLYSSSVLALYSLGRVTGMVLDSGEDITEAVSVYEGFNLKRTYTRSDIGGKDLTEILTKEVLESDLVNFIKRREDIRFIKEKNCFVTLDYEKDQNTKEVNLPDGTKINLGDLLVKIPENLFHPPIDIYNLPELIYNSIEKVNESDLLNQELLKNIVLAGGNCLFKNMGDRIVKELNNLLPKEFESRILKCNNQYPDWEGGSIITTLSTFKTSWITTNEYNEYGPNIVLRKCF